MHLSSAVSDYIIYIQTTQCFGSDSGFMGRCSCPHSLQSVFTDEQHNALVMAAAKVFMGSFSLVYATEKGNNALVMTHDSCR